MNKIIEKHLTFIVLLVLNLLAGCEKEKVPIITTTTITNITATSATSGGNITDEGSSTVITRGVCWSTGITPTMGDNKTSDAAGAGSFASNIVDLFGGTTYYVRAYATNSTGTGYGMALSFKTTGLPPSAPSVTTQNATSIQISSAQLNGVVNAMYYSTTITFEYGTTVSYGSTITATQSPVTGNTNISVSAHITDLTVATIYHYRIKAVNSLGTTYGNDLTFTTLGQVPTVTTLAATNKTTVGAQLNGTVNANHLSTIVTFEYGTTTNYGSTATATQSPVIGNANTSVNANVTGLTAGSTYHFRIKAVNSLGTTYGSDLAFTTLGQVPTVTTLASTNITLVGAQLNGTVNANSLSTVVTFEYGSTISYGSTITANQSPVTGGTNTNISASLTGLIMGTTYHFRIVATNSLGTTYGSDFTFTTFGQVPTVSTLAATSLPSLKAQLNGTVNANYLESTVTFEYGTSISYGSSITATQSPVTRGILTNASASLTGLTLGTIYHYRIVATNSLGTTYGSDMTFTAVYLIGESFAGGIIFYIDGTGQHGLVCAPTDQSISSPWGCYGTTITGADGFSIGTGNQNTIDIVNGCSTNSIAAKICYDLVLNGYDDWFLPSRDELGLMYTNLKANGLGSFAVFSVYWSSSELDNIYASLQSFENGNQTKDFKLLNYYVRAVRAF